MSDSDLDKVVDTAKDFLEKHWPGCLNTFGKKPDVPVFAGVAALGLGMLRAIYECPDCPGSTRVPVASRFVAAAAAGNEMYVRGVRVPKDVQCDQEDDLLQCPRCRGLFCRQDAHSSIRALFSDGRV